MTKKLTAKEIRENEEVNELVFSFQAGDLESGEELLRRFGGHPSQPRMTSFLGKYYTMLKSVNLNFKDKDTRKFLSLFTKDKETRDELKPFYQYADTKAKAIRIADTIRGICAVVPDDELRQELRFLFLRQCMRYKKTKEYVWFPGYLYNSYRFSLYHYIDDVSKSGDYYYRASKMTYIQDEAHVSEATLIKLNPEAFITTPILQFDDELGNSWVRGITCAEEFLPLTPLQRLIIRMSLYEEKSDREIAEKTFLHINTINRHKLKAIKIIKAERLRLQRMDEK